MGTFHKAKNRNFSKRFAIKKKLFKLCSTIKNGNMS